MKKLSIIASSLVLGLAITGGAIVNVHAAQPKSYGTYEGVPDITKRFEEMKFLTSSEKQILKDSQKKNATQYSKIANLEKDLRRISDDIMKDAKELIEEQNSIYSKNMNLWNKVYSEIPEKVSDKLLSHVEQLNAAKSLTSKEKEMLKEDAKRMDEIDSQLQSFYDKVNVATKGLDVAIEAEYKKIEEVDAKNQKIWDKIATHMDGK